MKFDLRFIFTLLIALAIVAAASPTVAGDTDAGDTDTDADQLEARHGNYKKTCEASCTYNSDSDLLD
ncbi:hypothetical protein N8T08_001776 [Aspergillus melleus]|uniref:Uncharacterized protein n=1 Tax=Aspergillus melleus TaxID=138277 RepID=A0ACC3AMN9_9EURO|nr:hypothetical protein N8T08_001776 [Aspergillus melleus]